jgi:AraC family transcriptional regulator, exoenzyme S synthesis regulatory protein ExsA
MTTNYQCIKLKDRVLFERVSFTPPFKRNGLMKNEACFLYNIKGSATIFGGTQKNSVNHQEAILLKCGDYVTHYQNNNSNEQSEILIIYLYPEVLKDIYQNDLPNFLKESSPIKGNLMHVINIEKLILNYLDGVLLYFDNSYIISDDLVILKLKELILLLHKSVDKQEIITNLFENLFNPSEVNFKEVIETNLYENLSISELAFITNNSLANFKRKFKSIYNVNPSLYIRNKKLQKAQSLVMNTSMRISDICFESGFNDISHFSKIYTIYFGISPTKDRENAKKTNL